MVYFVFLYFIMVDVKNTTEYKTNDNCLSYKIGKYKINIRREFEKQGASVLENVMCMIYDEMETRKNNKDKNR